MRPLKKKTPTIGKGAIGNNAIGETLKERSVESKRSPASQRKRAPSKRFSFLDRFSFVHVKPKKNRTERIRAQRNRSQIRSLVSAIALVVFILAIAVVFALGLPKKAYENTKEKTIDFSGRIGLAVGHVYVEGRTNTSLESVLDAAKVKTNAPILSYDIDTIRDNLLKVAWIKAATVQRRLPNMIYIRIVEREPLALWQRQGKHYLVDKDGVVIQSPIYETFKDLPIVIGDNAPAHTPKILNLLDRYVTVRKHLSAMVRIRDRRWDLTLDKTIVVKLPEENPEEALAMLSILLDEKKINADDVLSVDLRIPKQSIIRLAPLAAIRNKLRGKEKV